MQVVKIISRWLEIARDKKRLGDALALSAFAIYIVGGFLFYYASLRYSYPVIQEMHLNDTTANLSMVLAVAAIATRWRALSKWQIALFALTFALLLISAMLTDYRLLVHALVLMVAIGGIRLEKLCGIYSFILLVSISCLVLLSVFGLTYNKDIIPNSYLVFTYGFDHANSFGSFLISCCAALAYACWNRHSWWVPLIVSVAAAAFSFVFLSARSAALVLCVLALAIAVTHYLKQRGTPFLPGKAFFATLVVLPFFMLVVMIVSAACYDPNNQAFDLFNSFVNSRPALAHQYYVEHGGFTLFGSKYVVPNDYHTGIPFAAVDSGYCRLALSIGVVPLAAMVAVYLVAISRFSHEYSHVLILVILLLCSAHLMVECSQLPLVKGVMAIFISRAFADTRSVSNP